MPRKIPVSEGERDAPTERAMAVTPAAAERSSGATTAIVYDWRVGTSICEIVKRSSRSRIANGRTGIKGTKISRIFEGRWVKTIVRTNPIFLATQAALNADTPARIFAA